MEPGTGKTSPAKHHVKIDTPQQQNIFIRSPPKQTENSFIEPKTSRTVMHLPNITHQGQINSSEHKSRALAPPDNDYFNKHLSQMNSKPNKESRDIKNYNFLHKFKNSQSTSGKSTHVVQQHLKTNYDNFD